jgi:hypothetical protein
MESSLRDDDFLNLTFYVLHFTVNLRFFSGKDQKSIYKIEVYGFRSEVFSIGLLGLRQGETGHGSPFVLSFGKN